jgi:hypothetical protein
VASVTIAEYPHTLDGFTGQLAAFAEPASASAALPVEAEHHPPGAPKNLDRHPNYILIAYRMAIAADAYTIECMPGLYEVEVEPEVRSWLASLSDRDFGRVDFLVGLLAQHAEDLGEPYTRHLGGKVTHEVFDREVT